MKCAATSYNSNVSLSRYEYANCVEIFEITACRGVSQYGKAGPPGFEPGSEAPEVSVISGLHHRPFY